MPPALLIAGLEVADAGERAGGDGRRQRRREDEGGGEAAHEIDERGRGRDVAADHAIGLGERALDHREPMHEALALGNAAAARTIEADGVNLVEVSHRVMLVGHVADIGDWRDVAVHRVHGFKCNQLWRISVEIRQPAPQVSDVVFQPPPRRNAVAAVAAPTCYRT